MFYIFIRMALLTACAGLHVAEIRYSHLILGLSEEQVNVAFGKNEPCIGFSLPLGQSIRVIRKITIVYDIDGIAIRATI